MKSPKAPAIPDFFVGKTGWKRTNQVDYPSGWRKITKNRNPLPIMIPVTPGLFVRTANVTSFSLGANPG
jgi:hypothetical protein